MRQKNNSEQVRQSLMVRLFSSKRFTAVLSLILAVFAWLVVVMSVEPNTTITISQPVDFTYNTAPYILQGLDIIQKPSISVDLKVSGDGVVVGSLSASDFNVYPDYSIVTGPGEYQLRLKVERRSNKRFDIVNAYDLPAVTVRMEKMVTQKFAIEITSNTIPAEGYYLDKVVASTSEVTLRGPETEMSRVAKVVAQVDNADEHTESFIVPCKLIYLDADGKPITGTSITADVETVEVTVPIYKIKEVPIKLNFSGVPTGYDTAQLKPKLSQNTITIAGPPAVVDPVTEISATNVDLTKFKLGEPVLCDINMPENLRNVNNLQQISVTFDTLGYATKTVNVTSIDPVNVPVGIAVTFPVDRINNVTLVGRQSELDALDETGVVAQIDAGANNLLVAKGQQNIPVKIIVPSTKTVFATGTYTVLCNIEVRSESELAASASAPAS